MATTLSKDKKTVNIDPKDYEGLITLMNRHAEFDLPLAGKNKEGETVLVSICKDSVTTETFQHNNWCRENVYWRDRTTEELYHKC